MEQTQNRKTLLLAVVLAMSIALLWAWKRVGLDSPLLFVWLASPTFLSGAFLVGAIIERRPIWIVGTMAVVVAAIFYLTVVLAIRALRADALSIFVIVWLPFAGLTAAMMAYAALSMIDNDT